MNDGGVFSEILIQFVSCNEDNSAARGCKSQEEIEEWLANKSIGVLQNDYEFKSNDFDNPVRKNSDLRLFKIWPFGKFRYNQSVRKM